MKIAQTDFNDPQNVFDNLDEMMARAKQARADAVGEMATSVVAWFASLPAKFVAWSGKRTAAAQLMQLDDRLLADIGIGRGDIQAGISGRMNDTAVNSNDKDRNAA